MGCIAGGVGSFMGVPAELSLVRCAFFDSNLQSRMPLSFTPLFRLKLLHACGQWHSSRVFTSLTGWYCKLRPNTEGAHVSRFKVGTRTATQLQISGGLFNIDV
jgi:hypothetical protein